MNSCKFWRINLLTVIFLTLTASAPAIADECEDDPAAKLRLARQKHEQQTKLLINRLDLNRSQARKIVALADQAAALYIEAFEAEARLLPRMIEAYSQFAAEDRINQGFSDDVERRTVQIHRQEIRDRDQFSEQIIELEEQAKQILKKPQRDQLPAEPRRARPEKTPRTDARSRARAAARQREMERRAPLIEAHQELEELRRQKHPSVGTIGKHLLHPDGAALLCRTMNIDMPVDVERAVAVLRDGTDEYSTAELERQRSELSDLRAEINNWNLINGLHLTEDQIRQITTRYDETVKPDWEIKPRDARSGLARDAVYAFELQVEEVLNTGQRQVLAEYNPCLIPPKKLKDPVLVGQASDNSQYERWLERARKMSAKQIKSHVDASLEREAEHNGELDKQERRKRSALLQKAVRSAAAMSDAEFEMNKAGLAAQIAPPDRIQFAKDRVADLSRGLNETGVITRFMVNLQFVDQLRQRGEQLARGVDAERVDLAKAPQAENCAKGCAVNPDHSGGLPSKHEQTTSSD